MSLWGQQIVLGDFCFCFHFHHLKIYNCMTSSICPFTDSFLVWAELTDSKCIWLLFLPEAQQPQQNMPSPWLSMQSLYCSVRALSDTTTSEGDRKRMREARRISTFLVTQKDLFLMFRKMSGVQNDFIKDSNLFLSFSDGPVYQKN